MPSSLVAEVARSAAGWLLPSVPLASTWLLWFRCWHAVLPTVPNFLWIHPLDPSLKAATVRLLRFLLTGLTPASAGALRSAPRFPLELSAPPDNKSRFQCSDVMRLYMHSTCARRGRCSVTQHQVSARQSACTHEKEDLTTSRFVRVIYSSPIVYNKAGIVSQL